MTSQLDKPQEWTTGAEPPTDRQKAFLQTLADEKNDSVDPSSLNKSEASQKIDELKNAPTQNPSAPPKGPDGEKAGESGELLQNPDSWATGDEKATGKQTGYIATMARQAGEDGPRGEMSKTEASKRIEELKEKTGM